MSEVSADFDFEGPPAPRRRWSEVDRAPVTDATSPVQARSRHATGEPDGGSEAVSAPVSNGPAERTISPIAGRFGLGTGGKAVTVAALSVGCGVLWFASLHHGKGAHHPPKGPEQSVKESVDFALTHSGPPPGGAPTLSQPGPDAPSLTGAGAITPDVTMADGDGGGAHAASGAGSGPVRLGAARESASGSSEAIARHAAEESAARLQAIHAAPLMAYGGGHGGETPDAGTAAGLTPAAARAEGGGATELDQLRHGSSIGLVKAQRLPDRNFLIVAGALLPCTLETAMDTSAPGYVACRISRDVYSDNGAVVLMDKGSRVLGEYRSGQQQGRRRIFVLWNRVVTSDGVAADVSSPASDALGRAGFDGAVDTHFWDRFGGALLLSTIGNGLSAVGTANARFSSVVQAPQEAASVEIQNSVNIAPTLRKAQGSEVAIFVSRDLDFSGVYALKPR